MNKKQLFILSLTVLLTVISLVSLVEQTEAHGTEITYRTTTAIEIEAAFDNGEPMAEAQVIVYAPNDPATAWLRGQCDENGRFIFSPDTSITGDWAVSIRTAGHGEMLHIPIDESATVTVSNTPETTQMQTFLMAGAVIWGFVGTALYFSRRN